MLIEIKRFLVSGAVRPEKIGPSSSIYLLSLIVLSYLLLQKTINKTGYEINKQFFISTILYTPFLAALTAYLDMLIGATIASVAILSSLVLSWKFEELGVLEKEKSFRFSGLILALSVTPFLRQPASLHSLILFSPFLGAGFLLKSYLEESVIYALLGQYFDAFTSFLVISRNGSEINILGSIFVENFGPGGIFILKTFIVLPAVFYINRQDIEEKEFLLYSIAFLGFAIGLANLFR